MGKVHSEINSTVWILRRSCLNSKVYVRQSADCSRISFQLRTKGCHQLWKTVIAWYKACTINFWITKNYVTICSRATLANNRLLRVSPSESRISVWRTNCWVFRPNYRWRQPRVNTSEMYLICRCRLTCMPSSKSTKSNPSQTNSRSASKPPLNNRTRSGSRHCRSCSSSIRDSCRAWGAPYPPMIRLNGNLREDPTIAKDQPATFNHIFEWFANNVDRVLRLLKEFVFKPDLYGINICSSSVGEALIAFGRKSDSTKAES